MNVMAGRRGLRADKDQVGSLAAKALGCWPRVSRRKGRAAAAPPAASDDEEGEHHFFKEEKKNRIKMEISRRRHQIEENARLHEELIRLARLR